MNRNLECKTNSIVNTSRYTRTHTRTHTHARTHMHARTQARVHRERIRYVRKHRIYRKMSVIYGDIGYTVHQDESGRYIRCVGYTGHRIYRPPKFMSPGWPLQPEFTVITKN